MDDGPLDSCYPVFESETPEQEDTEVIILYASFK